jgi:REP element-mobilizing transposase RayT
MKTSQSPVPKASDEVDPLIGINAKTGWYPAARGGWSGGRKRILGPKALEANYYHVMSRTCGGDIFFDDTEKEALRRVLWRVAEFCGVQVLTYCVMGNHFHVLASVPHRESWMARFEGPEGERRLLGHLRSLYSKVYVEQLEAEFREWRRTGNEVAVQKKLESFKRRLCDLSRFVKEVKERFSRWYNKRHERKGTLWMDRFKSVLIEGNVGRRGERETDRIDVVRTMAAYIDLNPVRAGLVRDAADYPWCGYGEAKAGTRKAQRGICRVVEKPVDGWETSRVADVYAGLLGIGQAPSRRPTSKNKLQSFSTSKPNQTRQALQARANDGETLGVAELVRQRVRLFSEAMVLGSKAFVDEVFQIERSKFGPKRKEGARRVSECEGALYTMKRVRRWNE